MERAEVERWVLGYRRAWESNVAEDIASLFAEDATYATEPFVEPWRGREEIVGRWLERKDDAGTTTFSFDVVLAARKEDPAGVWANLSI